MDPVSIIGAVGAMAGLIDVATKSVKALSDLRDRWKDADLTLMLLASQLTTLRSALEKIRDWMENDLDEDPHHQLVMDLDVSIKCCELLFGKIDLLLGELGTEDRRLDYAEIVKVVFRGKNIEDVQKMVGQQVGALTLLLAACNCKALADQKVILEKSKTRKVLGRVQVDSASLYVNRSTESMMTRFTDNLSKISVTFNFDAELFSSKVYQQVLRGSVKDAWRRQQEVKKLQRQEEIDKRNQEYKLILLGTDTDGKIELMDTIKWTIEDGKRGSGSQDYGGDVPEPLPGPDEAGLHWPLYQLNYRLYNVHGNLSAVQSDETSTLLIESAFALVFFVDLTCYDVESPESPGTTELQLMLHYLQHLVLPRTSRKSSLILYFLNEDKFCAKLRNSPLEAVYPHFKPSYTTTSLATSYIIELFKDVVAKADKECFEVFANRHNPERTVRELTAVVHEIRKNNVLRESGLI